MLLGLMEGMEIRWLEDTESFDLRKAKEMAGQISGLLRGGFGNTLFVE
jgi:hypothetical protein